MYSIPLFKVAMAESVKESVVATLTSGYIGEGPKVNEFESKLMSFLGNTRVSAVNSCTSALHLCVDSIRTHWHPNWSHSPNTILSTPLTCLATNAAIEKAGFKIKWVDVDPNTCNMDLLDLSRKIDGDTAGVMVVHWGGYPVDLDYLQSVMAKARGVFHEMPVIEDCAHAFGAKYKGKSLGNHGNMCAFSFGAIKHLTTIEGGAIVSPHLSHYEHVRAKRWYGLRRYSSEVDRINQKIWTTDLKYNMNDVNATVGIENLKTVYTRINSHRKNHDVIRGGLGLVPGIQLLEQRDGHDSSCWVMTVLAENRDGFIKKLSEAGIQASPVHARNDHQPAFVQYRSMLPGLDSIADKIVCLPCGWWLSDDDIEKIINTVKVGW